MPQDWVGRSVSVVFADTRTDDHANGERCNSSDRVNDARSGEIAVALAEAGVGSQLRKPAATPGPVAIERISERAHNEGRNRECEELPAFRAGSGHDGERRIHEDHFEEEDHHDTYV